jgi:hypothetical protein
VSGDKADDQQHKKAYDPEAAAPKSEAATAAAGIAPAIFDVAAHPT